MRKVEILAPAGSYDTMKAALNSGADAVYLGGQIFGARAYADNLSQSELIDAIREVHIHGKKLYLTVNTLLKEDELSKALENYLVPLYEAGLDAVIVQDFGVLSWISKNLRDMDIHASTQMNVTGPAFAAWLGQFGVTRIVPARELSIEEIRAVKQASGLEIETFVHGALCYCYSGRCLMSSMIGGRSGNRGRCAQTCRLPYDLISAEHGAKRLNLPEERYLLSPKDIQTLALIPEMYEAGIDSFKIEGRMKKPEYTALVSAMYRKYVDLYERVGKQDYAVDAGDIRDLMDLYNRGGFSEGYYYRHNGRAMMSVRRPNHYGTKAAVVRSVSKTEAILEALEPLNERDVLETETVSGGRQRCEITVTSHVSSGGRFPVRLTGTAVRKGDVFCRTRNQTLIDSIDEHYIRKQIKEKIYGSLTISKDLPATMTVKYKDFRTDVSGETAGEALNAPLTAEEVRRRMLKTGGTPFVFEKLDVCIDDHVYMSVKDLNQLRRDAIDTLTETVYKSYERKYSGRTDSTSQILYRKPGEQRKLAVQIGRMEQIVPAVQAPNVDTIYVEIGDFESLGGQERRQLVQELHRQRKQFYIALPHIFRHDIEKKCSDSFEQALLYGADGVLVRNMESLLFARKYAPTLSVVTDYSIYTMNSEAKAFLKAAGASRVTVPLELNERELRQRGCAADEAVIYGYIPLMISAQCPLETVGMCRKNANKVSNERLYLKDRKGAMFLSVSCCRYCYSMIYNSRPLQLADTLGALAALGITYGRLSLTNESAAQTRKLLETIGEHWRLGEDAPNELTEFTKGHFKRGVE